MFLVAQNRFTIASLSRRTTFDLSYILLNALERIIAEHVTVALKLCLISSYHAQRKRLRHVCDAHNIPFTEQILLSAPEIKHAVEVFLKTTVLDVEEEEEQTS